MGKLVYIANLIEGANGQEVTVLDSAVLAK